MRKTFGFDEIRIFENLLCVGKQSKTLLFKLMAFIFICILKHHVVHPKCIQK